MKRKFAFLLFVLLLSATLVFAASSKTETLFSEFDSGTQSNTQVTSTDDGEVTVAYEAASFDVAVNNLPYDGDDSSLDPRMVVDSEGVLYATWHENDNDPMPNYDIFFAKSEDGGVTWTTPVKVDNADELCGQVYDSILPDIIVDSEYNMVYIVWVDNRLIDACGPGGGYNVWFSGSNDGGTNWSTDVLVNHHPSLNIMGGGALLDMTSFVGGNFGDVRGFVSKTGGPKLALGTRGDTGMRDILVTWMNDELVPDNYDIYFSKSASSHPWYDFDADFTTPGYEDAKIDDNMTNMMMPFDGYSGVPSIATNLDTGIVSVVYEDARTTGLPFTDIFAVTFTEYGSDPCPFFLVDGIPAPAPPLPAQTIGDVRVDGSIGNHSLWPDVDIHPYRYIDVVWQDDAPEGYDTIGFNIHFAKSTNDGASFGSETKVDDTNNSSFWEIKPTIDINPANYEIYVDFTKMVMEGEHGDVNKVWFDISYSDGGMFGTDVMIPTPGHFYASFGDIVYDPSTGNLFDIWNDYDPDESRGDGSNDSDVYSSRSLDMGEHWGKAYLPSTTSGMFTSQEIDLGKVYNFLNNTVSWTESLNDGDIKVRLRTADTQANLATASFYGPDGTNTTYYTDFSGETISHSNHDGHQWMQYRAFFTPSSNQTVAPVLLSVTIGIEEVPECTVDADCDEGETCENFECVESEGGEGEGEGEEGEGEEGEGEEGEGEEGEGEEGEGEPECQINADCDAGETCKDNVCEDLGQGKTICDSDLDCADGEVCTSAGYCGLGGCADFPDVSNLDPLCPAVEFVKEKGIFEGYPDGTFGWNQVINRVETAKVVLEAFDYKILEDEGTDLGYSDVERGAWYMKYLRTAQAYDIITGYPDLSMKPAQIVNRVELLKIFFKTAPIEISACAIELYPDTPLDESTSWYIPYICYTKTHNLMDPDEDGNFNPSDGMLRGDVAELFYRYDKEVGEY